MIKMKRKNNLQLERGSLQLDARLPLEACKMVMEGSLLGEKKIGNYYKRLIRSIEMLVKGDFTSIWIVSEAGIGKSYQVDAILDRLKADYIIFSGDISDAYLYQFVYDNKDRIIVIRDVAKLLRRLACIDMFKAMTETRGKRIIQNLKFKDTETPDNFEFRGSVIFEMNAVMGRYRDDLEALFSRGDYVELNFSRDEIAQVMCLICQNDWQREVTDYLIGNSVVKLNLRLQDKCFRVYNASVRDGLDWKSQVDLFIKEDMTEPRKLLYRCTGAKPIRRMEFVKYLVLNRGWSMRTAHRKIDEWLELGEIYSDGKQKQAILSLEVKE